MNTQSGEHQRIKFIVGFEGKPDQPLDFVAHAFSPQGKLLASSPVREGAARLEITEADLKRARVFFAPALPETRFRQAPTLSDMHRVQAYEPAWRFERGQKVYEVLPIPRRSWEWWFWCSCRVRGRVIKHVATGGATYELPVCNARVHVCEVDRFIWLIPRLPDHVVWRLREELLRVIDRPPIPVQPEPDPWIKIDPGVIDPAVLHDRELTAVQRIVSWRAVTRLGPQPEPPDLPRISALTRLSPQPEPPDLPVGGIPIRRDLRPVSATAALETKTVLPASTRAALAASSITVVRRALLDNAVLLRPWICHWPWIWPYLHRCEEVAVLTTDAHGRFDTTIWFQCLGDHPDLYFWVEYPVEGSWETVYHPPIACNTHWDYVCGTEVTIRVTDARVPGCWDQPEVLGKKVVVKSIGPDVSMSDINRASIPAEAPFEGTGKAGELAHGYLTEWGTKQVAFGDVLEPRVDFGDGLGTANITHYRWSYRPLGSTSDDDWTPIRARVARHYRKATLPGAPTEYGAVELGPDADDLFVIDPALPADGEDWEVLSEHFDLASAFFNTQAPDVWEGKFELKLELFRKVGGVAQRIDLTAEAVDLYETSNPAPFLGDVVHTAAPTSGRLHTEEISPGVAHVFGYRLVLHIDNRKCFGTIEDVTIAGIGSGPCGFLEYDPAVMPAVTLSFRARHDGDFGAFRFLTTRVATHLPAASAHGLTQDAVINGFVRVGDTFTKNVPVATLLGEGVAPGDGLCVRAAFAEGLYVYALVVNGYRRLWELDGPRPFYEDPTQIGMRAFSLTPEEPAP